MSEQHERAAARFIAAYEALCREHGAMVIMLRSGDYLRFGVGFFFDDSFITQACEEMRIGHWTELVQENEQ